MHRISQLQKTLLTTDETFVRRAAATDEGLVVFSTCLAVKSISRLIASGRTDRKR
ncbi:hypothetical protein [Flavilitoribacter nigricans]|uniref:hypothetical protein n=1 Tax=Flavilitoribacter nigricans TaxID=70997 RepID=UPI0014761DBB|nr:hypothetical protein [Flavilitoribacter nigricans]